MERGVAVNAGAWYMGSAIEDTRFSSTPCRPGRLAARRSRRRSTRRSGPSRPRRFDDDGDRARQDPARRRDHLLDRQPVVARPHLRLGARHRRDHRGGAALAGRDRGRDEAGDLASVDRALPHPAPVGDRLSAASRRLSACAERVTDDSLRRNAVRVAGEDRPGRCRPAASRPGTCESDARAAGRARLHLRGRLGAGPARQGRASRRCWPASSTRAPAPTPRTPSRSASRRARSSSRFNAGPDAVGGSLKTLVKHADEAFELLAPRARLAALRRGRDRARARPDHRRACATSRTIPASWPRAASSPRRFRATPTAIRRAAPSRASPRSPGEDIRDLHARVIADGREKIAAVGAIDPERLAGTLDGVFGALARTPMPRRRCRRPRSPAAARATSSTSTCRNR